MAKIIASTNNKWWVWKTSTIVNISQILAKKMKKKVLVIDLDHQCNLSQAILWKSKFKVNRNAGELFNINSEINIEDLIVEKTKKLHIIPWKVNDLFLVDAILSETHGLVSKVQKYLKREYEDFSDDSKDKLKEAMDILDKIVWDREEWIKVLKKRLSYITNDYDYIFLDLPPSVARIPENAWVASDYLLVPISDNFALNWTEWLINKMIDIKKNYNDNLKFIFFFNKVPLYSNASGKNYINREYKKLMSNFIWAIKDNKKLSSISIIMPDVIQESKDIEKSYSTWKSLLDMKNSKVLEDYVWFAKELEDTLF